ncbi:hypothetical protein WICMUC_002075 [Wickerhamomyces mucosus]|uniref:Flavin-containing monooxygenase n=1 Tax=Wickerhamomyces mucosus TaxID=1378264 RepID=A0A9P8TF24_9ASCO|nr:hypothetical protein WICMUC_002075 [Wickerhamomyces mucosus]
MTGDFNIKRVAIIGAGYSGLQTLADLIHTSSNGESTINTGKLPSEPAFPYIKVFEQSPDLGGAWRYTAETDPHFPSKESLEDEYWEPSILENEKLKDGKTHNWKHNAMYDNLYTNISYNFMTPSTLPIKKYPNRIFDPFLTHREVLKILHDLADHHDLRKYIQFNSDIKNVLKTEEGKYQLTIERTNTNGEITIEIETFDSLVIATGRFKYPHIPQIHNLAEFNAQNPGVISHSKSFRKSEDFKDKKVLIVGSSVSSIGLLEYLRPIAKELHLSRRTFINDPESSVYSWYVKEFNSGKIVQHDQIVDFDLATNEVIFKNLERAGGFDHIFLATGYHIHFPFLPKDNDNLAKISKSSGDQRGRIENLFHYVFSIGEPTIAHVGFTSSGFFVHLSEAQGVSIAGVWSNAKKLPSLEAQRQWHADRIAQKAKSRTTHQYEPEEAVAEIEYLTGELGVKNRGPKITSRLNTALFEREKERLGVIYEKFASGEFDESYILKTDTSGLPLPTLN